MRLARQRWLDGDCTLEEANAIAGRDVRDKQGKVPAMWPTPTAVCGKGSGAFGIKSHSHDVARGSLKGVVIEEGNGGQLNPTWVEWLMGFPLGWTDCGASETPSFPRSLS